MAIAKIHFNEALTHGRMLRTALTNTENGHDGIDEFVAAVILMIDGDHAVAANYGEVMTRLGTTSVEKAKELVDELKSLKGKFDSDAPVQEVQSALRQAFAKLR